ncbi:transient receptor potential channel [Chlorella sorokiniana]|uniref:Transient receptor potential channel n=1 Tax=Chlorella sorokiniana TaxID=3076 RepID=A0A2P6TJD8_CHLSO|nr:transient receptor potential channel [Chlorella sorokiniana]|eukprot:PRW39343.1 transient receptor potential channel [Chlorella sorokiniana]
MSEEALLQEVQAPWEFASQLEQGGDAAVCTVRELLAAKKEEVLRTLQRQGVSKLGEFRVPADLAFPAFGGEPILTLGSRRRHVDYESFWGRRLHALHRGPRPTGWSNTVVLEAFVVNVRGAADPDKDGLVQPLLKQWQAGAVGHQAFGIPAVQAVVEFKWRKWARRMLLGELACFCLWAVSFFTFTVLFQDEDERASLAQLLATGRGQATVAAEVVALLAMVPFLLLEWGTLAAYGWSGWFSLWNALDLSTYILQVAIAWMHLTRQVHTGYLSIACALQCILLLFRLQFFSRVFAATRFAFLEAVKEAVSAISIYLFFMLLIMMGFAVAFHVLFRKDQKHEEFATITNAFLTMYANQNGLLDLGLMRSSHNPVSAVLLAVGYAFVMGMVIVNMLIGLMSNALDKTNQDLATKSVLHKAEIIDELEATIPRFIEDRFKGWGWYPEWIHILRIDPDRLDKPSDDLASMWSSPSDEGSSAVEAKLQAMQAQLDRLEALLLHATGGSPPAASAAAAADSASSRGGAAGASSQLAAEK